MRAFVSRCRVARPASAVSASTSAVVSTARRAFANLTAPEQYRGSARVSGFGASVFGEFTALAQEHKSVNLGQGFPDFSPPEFLQAAARESFTANNTSPSAFASHQYTRSWGHLSLVNALAKLYSPLFGRTINPMNEIVVTSGATEAGFATMQAILNPGDEVILFEPSYDAYGPWVTMAGGVPKYVPLTLSKPKAGASTATRSSGDFVYDPVALERALSSGRVRALMLNTPHNPLGKVFTKAELLTLVDILKKYPNVIVVADEVYEFITFDGTEHVRIATLPGMWNRTITISSAGKTFSCTGWKVGWCVGPPNLMQAVFLAHQWIPFCVSTPLQDAVARALGNEKECVPYFANLKSQFAAKRDRMVAGLQSAGLTPIVPQGGYFVMADTESLYGVVPKASKADAVNRDVSVARYLTKTVGVTPIPPSAFYTPPNQYLAHNMARFAYCKNDSLIESAVQRLAAWKAKKTA